MIGDADYVDEHIEALVWHARETHHAARHAGAALPGSGARIRDADHRRNFRIRHFDFHGHNDYGLGTANTLEAAIVGRARCARHGQRHGRTRGKRDARRGGRRVARSCRDQDVGRRALAVGSEQARRSLLRPPRAREQADRRRERLHADRRHPRRRRHERQSLREPADAGALRPASHLCDGQADGEGEPRFQPRAPATFRSRRSRSSSSWPASSSWGIRRST